MTITIFNISGGGIGADLVILPMTLEGTATPHRDIQLRNGAVETLVCQKNWLDGIM